LPLAHKRPDFAPRRLARLQLTAARSAGLRFCWLPAAPECWLLVPLTAAIRLAKEFR
jgi:hypothetical protein